MPLGALAAAGSLGGAAIQSSAAQSAAAAQAKASAQNQQFEQGVYNTGLQQLTPTINQGLSAGNELAGLEGIGGNPAQSQQAYQNYLGSTNYQFLLGQGDKGIAYANAPDFNSGATGKALINYNQGEAGNALSGYEGLLTNQQGLGAQSALGLANFGNNNASLQAQQSNLNAATQGTANLISGGAYGSALSGLTQNQSSYGGVNALSGLFGGSGGGGAVGNGAYNPDNLASGSASALGYVQ